MTILATIKPDMKGLDMLFSLRDAAKELSIHPQTLKRHKYASGLFEKFGIIIGRSLVFSEDEIAAMRKLLPKAHSQGNTTLSVSQVNKRQMLALKMFEDNKTLGQIAKRLKFRDTSGAYRAIQAAKKKMRAG